MEKWMHRAMQLARLGQAAAAPNPLVGCVIVHPEAGLIGEGWHAAFGGAHAEVQAIASVKQPELLSASSVIVNLEPCSHFGKTPPCSRLLIEKAVAEVIISNEDPNPLVSGRGIEALRTAGIKVHSGILEKEGRQLNRFFFTAQEKKRPFVCLKWAQSADGFIGPEDGRPIKISSPQSLLAVHTMRAGHQAIMAGRNTLRTDNPLLNLRNWPGRQPVRIVCDPGLNLPEQLNIFQDDSAPAMIFNRQKQGSKGHISWHKMQDPDDLNELLSLLFRIGIHSLLVEGGSRILQKFLHSGLWDEALVFTSPRKLGSGIAAPEMRGFTCTETSKSGPDCLQMYRPLPE